MVGWPSFRCLAYRGSYSMVKIALIADCAGQHDSRQAELLLEKGDVFVES